MKSKKFLLLLATALFQINLLYASDDINTNIGFGIVPSNKWSSGQLISEKDYLDLDFDASALTTYEGSIWTKNGLKLGVNVNTDDNMVGKINNVVGMLGYGKLSLRVQKGKLKGTAKWTGTSVDGQPSSVKFDNTYNSVDLIYWRNIDDAGGLYFGLGYTSYELPVQINGEVYRDNDYKYATAVYQEDLKYKIYTLSMGMDTMATAAMQGATGFGLWMYTQDKIGFGSAKISDEAARRLAVANGREVKNQNMWPAIVDYDLTVGLMWGTNALKSNITAGIGYNIGGLISMPFGGGDIKGTDYVRASPWPYLMHHGPEVKLIVNW